jgi:micrococcal nuclease
MQNHSLLEAIDEMETDTSDSGEPSPEDSIFADSSTGVPSLEEVYVEYVIDGDTVKVRFADGTVSKVRIIGIDCPETEKDGQEGEFYADEATEYAQSLLQDELIYLEKDQSDTDQYGRLLRYIWLEIPDSLDASEIEDHNFSALVLSLGLAEAVSYGDDTKYADLFFDLEEQAQADDMGMWS